MDCNAYMRPYKDFKGNIVCQLSIELFQDCSVAGRWGSALSRGLTFNAVRPKDRIGLDSECSRPMRLVSTGRASDTNPY